MNTPQASGPVEPEVLFKRRRPWWRSLWVRIPIVVALMWVITGLFFWWHCQSAWAVFRVNGLAELSHQSPLHSYRRGSWLTSYLGEFFIQDRDVTSVMLIHTAVDDQWLVRLQRFPKLERATFDGGQIGPGLRNLADLQELKAIHVIGKQRRIIRGWIDFIDSSISGGHFLLIPQIESLALSGFQGTISEMDQLRQHPRLREVYLGDISRLSHVLRQIETCQNIKSLIIRQDALDEEALGSICRMSHLQTLTIERIAKTDNVDSQLKQSLPTTNIDWRP